MKKLIYLTFIVLAFSSCEKILDVNPYEGGISEFSKAEQFDAILNNIGITRNRVEWSNTILASDDCNFEQEWQVYSSAANIQYVQIYEALCTWNEDQYRSQFGSGSGFLPFQSTYNYMYHFNQIIDKIDGADIAGSPLLKKQVKAEAKFWRAFYHFLLAVEFCTHPGLNNGQNPGIGYRNSISAATSGVETRGTVKSTFDNIVKDLEEAEVALIEVGKTGNNTLTPWRITAPSVQAQLARTHLYLGNYQKAFDYAKKAYTAYNFLYDLKDQTRFRPINLNPIQTEVFNGVTYSVFPQYPAITDTTSTVDPNSSSRWYYKEDYFRFVSQLGAQFKMPPTQELYNTYEASDLRKTTYYDNNFNINTASWLPPRFMNTLISKSYAKHLATRTQCGYNLGVSVPEIMLIMAECRARGNGDGENASIILRQLRAKRFPTTYTDNIGGSIDEVKAERRRELAMTFRWYDLKRYNALDNANITITKRARRDPFSASSDIVTYKLAPNAPTYALPMLQSEVELLKWSQNEYGGVTKQ